MGVGKIARRGFLIGSAAIVGGVAFGVWKARSPLPNPLSDTLEAGSASFNPWVLIDAKKITLITPHADLGQGAVSMQALLIAEELDLELGQFETSFGSPDAAYWNTAMAADGVPFMSTDRGFVAESARTVMGGMIKLMGVMQGTGGSSSVPDSYDKLRMAGAVARETLKAAAAVKASREMPGKAPPASSFETERGAVFVPGSDIRYAYTELAEIAGTLEPVEVKALREPSEWRLIGKSTQRLDTLAKSTGTQEYGIDLELPGMVYAAVRTNPRQGGEMLGYDASGAQALRGVERVLEVTGGVAVIADNTWRAFEAVDAIEIEWGPAPYPPEQAQHWEALAASFSDEHLDSTWRDEGDAEAAIGGAAIEAEYRSPYVAHQPLEPLNATVLVTEQGVDIWTGHQFPILLVQQIGAITGHEADQIRFQNQYMGGSFGHRLEFGFVKQAAEIANQLRGTPVKLTYKREEDFAHDFPRPIAMGRARGSVKDGQVEAMDLSIASPSVIGSQLGRSGLSIPGPDSQIAAGAWNNPYELPDFRMRAYRAAELAPVSSWRAVGANAGGFIFDSFLDELIHAAGADPMQERIRLMGHDVSRRVLEAAAEMSSWGGELAPEKGRGVAFVESFGVPVAEVVEVTNTGGGIRLDKVWVAADVGRVVDPVNFDNLVKGGAVWGLGHAMNCEITYADGMAEQENFDSHSGMRMYQCPEIEVRGLENGDRVLGIGEPPVPPTAPALANAIFAATGQRIRELPLNRHVEFI